MDDLVVGSDSLIGNVLINYLKEINYYPISTTRRLNLVNERNLFLDFYHIGNFAYHHFRNVYFCAGETSIAKCEADPNKTAFINVEATFNLAKKLKESGAQIIFISSNTVFDGSKDYPNEDEKYSFTTTYGRQKSEAELKLLSLGAGIKIVRITKVISPKTQILSFILEKIKSKKSCELFNDLFISPLSIQYLCQMLVKIAESPEDGIFHLSGAENFSYADFAINLASFMNADISLINGIPSTDILYKPKFARLGMEKTQRLLHISSESLDSLFSNLLSDHSYENLSLPNL